MSMRFRRKRERGGRERGREEGDRERGERGIESDRETGGGGRDGRGE